MGHGTGDVTSEGLSILMKVTHPRPGKNLGSAEAVRWGLEAGCCQIHLLVLRSEPQMIFKQAHIMPQTHSTVA